MDPKLLIPTPDTIPVPWPWFKALLIPCFTIHLLFMNALVGSCIIGLVHMMRPNTHRSPLEMSRRLSRKLPFFMVFTINLGVAALLFIQVLYGHFFYTSSILMAVWWLGALGLVLTAYAAIYLLDFKFDILAGFRVLVLALVAACLLAVAFIFTNNMTLMLDPASWSRYFDQPGGTLWHLDDPTLIPRYLHFVTASVAVGGLVQAYMNRHHSSASGLHWFTAATTVQFFLGFWFFLCLPQPIRQALMGGDIWASVVFAVALLAVLVALVCGIKRWLWPTVGAATVTILTMVLLRDAVRSLYLRPFFSVDDLMVEPQYTPMVVFGIFLILGLAAVAYMLKKWKGAMQR